MIFHLKEGGGGAQGSFGFRLLGKDFPHSASKENPRPGTYIKGNAETTLA